MTKQTYCERLLEAYDLVLEDLSDWTEDQWKFVADRLREMRADVVEHLEAERTPARVVKS